jgi:hypothetical protein
MSVTRIAPTPALAVVHQSAAARLVNLIVHPPSAFAGINHESPWALAFVVIVCARIASLFVFYHPELTPGKLTLSVLFQVGTVLPLLLVSALLVWFAARVCGVRLAWAAGFSIVTHIDLAYTVATLAAASVAGALLPESADVDPRNPPFTSLAPLASGTTSTLVQHLAAAADVRAVYVLALLFVALRCAAPMERRQRIWVVVASVAGVRLVGVALAALLR